MSRKAPKKYNVTVSHQKHPPEEEARLREQIREAIYNAKMSVLKMKEDQKQNSSDKTNDIL